MSNEKNFDSCGCTNHISGVHCEVKTCQYHDGETYCTARQIEVCNSTATSSSDTACATFKERK